jgi:hypothetical protein
MKLPKYELRDECGESIRRFFTLESAQKHLSDGYSIIKIVIPKVPKPPSDYEQVLLMQLGEPLF